MKFGKEFIKQMVPEWTEAYMDYYGLKDILHEIRQYKQKNQRTLSRASQHKKLFGRTVSGVKQQSSSHHSEDTEEQVIDVTTSQQDGSKEVYETNILKQSEEGGDTDADFFRKLDEELNKVNTFYKDKVEEEKNEASQLIKQLDALNALRIKVKKPHFNGSTAENDNSFGGSEHCHSAKNTGGESNSLTPAMDANDKKQQEQREKTAGASEVAPAHTNNFHSGESKNSDYKEDPLEVLEHVKKNNTLQSPMSTLKRVFKDSKEEELSFNKEELKKAEERLRVAFIEFYHKLHLLKHYSFANLSAFSKVMEKYEKITSRRAFRSYMEVVDGSYLGNSDEINGLLDKVEATFIRNFSNSNHREGMKSLRPKAKRERHRVTFLSGFFSGCALALLVAVILRIEVQNIMDKQVGKQYMQSIFPLYSLFLYIILHMYMYAANLLFWRRYRVNYPFIFGFKRGTELGYQEVFLLSTGILVLALAGFLANWHLDMDSSTQNYKTVTELVPLGLLTLILVIAFCPFDIIYRSSRFFFIRRIFRIICAPFYPVTMADFFLADQLTSQALRISVLYVCYYGLGEYSRRQNKCHSRGVYNTLYFIVAVIPFWFRFLQCIRRLYKDRDPIHGYNGVKYFSTIVAVLIRTAAELRKGTTWMVLALVSSAVATLMNTSWDIGVDWGLLRRHSKNKYLRDRLLISHKSVYFIAMVINVVLRLVWMQQVLEFNLHTIHKMTITAIISCLEIIRRGIWSFFRLENEHLNNVGKYRAFKSVPLPFCYSDEETDEDVDKDD